MAVHFSLRAIRRLAGMAFLAVFAAALFVLVTAEPLDPAGDLDVAFSTDGRASTNFAEVLDFAESRGAAFQSSGKIVLGGSSVDGGSITNFALVRLLTDGTQDMSFGTGGRAKTVIGSYSLINDIAVQSDDKIVAVGFANNANNDFAIARYTVDGALDTTFSGDGIVTVDFVGDLDRANGVAIQDDGKIVVAGYRRIPIDATHYNDDVALVRLNTDGSLDATFGTGGKVVTAVGSGTGQDQAASVAVIGSGAARKIVIVGTTKNPSGDNTPHVLLAQYTTAGVLDGTFGSGGIQIHDVPGNSCLAGYYCGESLNDVAVQADGKIVAVGDWQTWGMFPSTDSNPKTHVLTARFNANGSFDGTFNGSGYVITGLAGGYYTDYGDSVAIAPDNKIVVFGWTDDSEWPSQPPNYNMRMDHDFLFVRFNTNGSYDTTFGGTGKVKIEVSDNGSYDDGDTVLVDASGRVIGVGMRTTVDDSESYIAAARLTSAGVLDTTFGLDGADAGTTPDGYFYVQLIGGSRDVGEGMAVQSDGKVVVAGWTDNGSNFDFGLVRYNTDGSLDTTFSGDGMARAGNGTQQDTARDIAIQSDGKFIVVGDSYGTGTPSFTVMRFTTAGALDGTYDGDGIATTTFGTNGNQAYAVAIDSSGRALVGGSVSDVPSLWDIGLARFNTNGSPDTSFDGDGKVRRGWGGFHEIHAIAVQPDGKIVVGGRSSSGSHFYFFLARFNDNGSLDTTFASPNGYLTTRVSDAANTYAGDEIRDIVLLPDGRIVAAGKGLNAAGLNAFGLARYLANGTLDATFGVGGKRLVNTVATNVMDELAAIALQHDEKVVGFGRTTNLTTGANDIVLARFNWTDGSLDTTYGSGGYVTTDFTGMDVAAGGAVLSGGKAVMGGTTGGSDFAAARYLGDPAPTTPSTPDLQPASDSGTSSTDNITNDNTPTFGGTCVTGETVALRVGGVETTPYSRGLCVAGLYAATIAVPLADASYSITAVSLNGAGTSSATGAIAVTIDTVALPPTVSSPTEGSTVNPNPTIAGAGAENGASIAATNGGSGVCTTTAPAGSWSCATTIGPGSYALNVTQTDIAGNTSTPAVRNFIIKAPTTTVVVTSVTPTVYGQPVTFTATVDSGGYGTPNGTVQFTRNGESLGSAVTLSAGTASLTIPSAPVGTLSIGAAYGGATLYFPSTASAITQVVNKADTTNTVTPSANPSLSGDSLTLTATIAAVAPGAGTATGTVTFKDGGSSIGTAALSSGAAALTTSTLTPGVHSITAEWGGDGNFNGSNATAFNQVIQLAPSITSGNAATFVVGTPGSFTVTTTGYPVPGIAVGGTLLPSGLTAVDNGDGTFTIAGTPNTGAGGSYALTVTASNGVGSNAVQNFTLTVNEAPAVTSAASATFVAGTAGSFSVTTRGYPAPSISIGGSLPSGVTGTDNTNGTATIAGTPAAGTGGAYPLTITVANGIGSNAEQAFTLTVNETPAITSADNTSFTIGQPGTFTVTATGYPAPTLSLIGSLPNGVSFTEATGVLTGTPGDGTIGNYPLQFNASNGVGSGASQSFTLRVNEAPQPGPAFTVTTLDDHDDGVCGPIDCSMREAIGAANAAPGANTISLTTPATYASILTEWPAITDPAGLTIESLGATGLSGNGSKRVFTVTSGATLLLRNLTIASSAVAGTPAQGGAILNAGTLTLDDVEVQGNAAIGPLSRGGAIFNSTGATLAIQGSRFFGNAVVPFGDTTGGALFVEGGSVSIVNSSFHGNSVQGDVNAQGGAIYVADGTVTIVNTTFADNRALVSAGAAGGAIYAHGGTILLSNVTFAGNTAAAGAAMAVNAGAVVTVNNSLAAGSLVGPSCSGTIAGGTHNLAEDGSCGATFTQVAAMGLGSLGDHGGLTLTMALLPGSPAIDAGDAATCQATDARGVARGTCDVGAFESRGFAFGTPAGTPQHVAIGGAFAQALSVPVTSASGEPVDGGVVTFAAPIGAASTSFAPFGFATIAGGTASINATANAYPGGPYTVTATANGVSGSVEFALTNDKATPVVTVTATPNPAVSGETVTYTAVVSYPGGAWVPAGAVAFTDNGAPIAGCTGVALDAGGVATCTVAPLAGSHTVAAAYAGDTNYLPASNSTVQTVSQAATATTVGALVPTASVVGQPVVVPFTVSVVPPGAGTPTGTVTVTDGTGASCSADAAAGQCTLTPLTTGSKTITATYEGDVNFAASAGASALVVSEATTVLVIDAVTPVAPVTGEAVTVAFTLSVAAPGGGTPTGSVTVGDGAGASCTAAISAGQCTLTPATAGAKTLTATFAGDANYGASSDTQALTVAPASTTTMINRVSPFPSVPGQPITIEFVVAPNPPGSGTATGTVTVSDGAGASCSATVGAGQCTLTPATAGDKTLTASYEGDANYQASSGSLAYAVSKATTTTTVSGVTPNPSVVGQAVTVQFAVAVAAPAVVTPTGTVTVSDGAGASCSAAVAAGQCTLTPSSAGARTVTASYAGDANTEISSGTGALTVSKASTTTGISGLVPNTSVVGQPVVVQFTVSVVPPGTATPSGLVTVTDGTGASCTADASAGQCTLTPATAGTKTITASYAGNELLDPSSGTAGLLVDKGTTTTSITGVTPNGAPAGTPLTVQFAVVVQAPASGTPTGTVTVADGVDSCTAPVASGSCVITLTTPGERTLTATYAGDANFLASMSAGFVPPPAPFSKTSPANGATRVNGSPLLSWEASNGAVSYDYCLGASAGACVGSWTTADANTSVRASFLRAKTSYFWHVRARHSTGTTDSTGDAWSFTTAADSRDLDGDGYADIVWRHRVTGALKAWFMNGTTILREADLPGVADFEWKVVATADFNGDDRADLFWRNARTGENAIWFMNGENRLGHAAVHATPDIAWRVAGTGDFNADGSPDLVWRHSTTGEVVVWFMTSGVYTGYARVATIDDPRWTIAGAGDFDGDGQPDLVWRNVETGDNALWFMNGTRFRSYAPLEWVADTRWAIAGTSDINGDGRPDLLWRNTATGDNLAWLMNNEFRTATVLLPANADTSWDVLQAPMTSGTPGLQGPDFNGDRKADLVWRNVQTGENIVWYMQGTAYQTYARVTTIADINWRIVATGDFNSDGSPDFLWRNIVTGENVVWFMKNAVQLGYKRLTTVADLDWKVAGAADFNGDTKVDILWRNQATGDNVVWLMDGTVYLGYVRLAAVTGTNWRIAGTADYSGDAKPDLLWRNVVTGEMIVWRMNGTAYLGYDRLPLLDDLNAIVIGTHDLNTDGHADIIWRDAVTGANFAWLMNGTAYIGHADVRPITDVKWGIGAW